MHAPLERVILASMIEGLRTKDIAGSSGHEGIVVYGLLDCEPCREAEQMLTELSIPHKYAILEWQKPDVRKALKKRFFKEYGAQPIYPILEYNDTLHIGFDKKRWSEILNLETNPE